MKIKQYIPPANDEDRKLPEKKYPMLRVELKEETSRYELVFCGEDGRRLSGIIDSKGIKYCGVRVTLEFHGYATDFAEWDENGKFLRDNGTVEIKDWHPGVDDEPREGSKKYPMWRTVVGEDGMFKTIFCDENGGCVAAVISQNFESFRNENVDFALSCAGYETDFAEWTDRGEFIRFKKGFV